MKRAYVPCALSLVLLTGCADIIEGSSQNVQVETMPPSQAVCSVKNSRGDWNAAAPTAVQVKKSKTDLTVNCLDRNSGYAGTKTYESSFEPWVLGNILLGGLIGLGVDYGTGAAWDYPETVTIPIQPTYQPAGYVPPPMPVAVAPLAPPAGAAPAPAPVPGTPPVATAPTPYIAPVPTYATPAPTYAAPAAAPSAVPPQAATPPAAVAPAQAGSPTIIPNPVYTPR